MAIKQYSPTDIANMEHRYRVHFINSLSGYKSANLIGSIDQHGLSNLSVVSSVVHLGADPALIAFVHRPQPTPRNTLDNIEQTGCFTINHIGQDIVQAAHQASARYPGDVSEFDVTELDEQYTEFKAPYVRQSQIKIGVEFRQKITIELNGTFLMIGEIVEVIVDDDLLADDGKIDLVAAKTVAVSGLDEYHSAESLGRLPYAKVKIL